jgi:hypothetical protein
MADIDTVRKRLKDHAREFLQGARTVRTSLQVVGIGSPVVVGSLKAIPPESLNEHGELIVAVLQFVFLGIGAAAGLLVLLTDKSAVAVMSDAQALSEQLDETKTGKAESERFAQELQAELAKSAVLGLTVDSMRYAIDVAVSPGPAPIFEAQVRELLDQLVVAKHTLFGMGDELWNFSVYLWRPEAGELSCIACRRPARSDEEAAHRSWAPGEGHVGKAFQMKRALICEDSTDVNVRGFFDAPEAKRAEYDDATRYRSLAAIPFVVPGDSEPAGVVVATSNIKGRFQPTAEGDDYESVKPVRALSKTIATLLGVNRIRAQKESSNG